MDQPVFGRRALKARKERRPINNWSRLDNVAKVFPATSGTTDTQVFRLSCDLIKPVKQDVLQRATEDVLGQFEFFRYVLRRGLFWYYLDESNLRPVVRQEYKKACAPLYIKDQSTLLFEVTYYKTRINLEVYHVLSDGTGAMHFFKALIARYLSLRFGFKQPADSYDATSDQMQADSFLKHYDDSMKVRRVKEVDACRVHGRKHPDERLELITGHMSAGAVLSQARSVGMSLTAYLCACMTDAVREEASISDLKRPIVASVPVNLRRYFPSGSMRNFFNLIAISYQHEKGDGFERILERVDAEFKKKLIPDRLARSMNAYVALEENILAKMIPLYIKDAALRWAYRQEYKKRTYTLSNVGAIDMPGETAQHIRSFDVYTSTNLIQLCVCSFGDVLSVTFSSPFANTEVTRNFFRKLSSAGIEVEVFSNMPRSGNGAPRG